MTATSTALVTSDEPRLSPALSPSRATDFKTCPLRFRFRVIDRIPEPPSVYTARGTLVHAALEHLYTLPPHRRTVDTALDVFEGLRRDAAVRGELDVLFDGPDYVTRW